MKARLEKDQEILVVHLMGRIGLDSVETFRQTCLTQLLGERLVFNFSELSFVGSMGVSAFLETLGALGSKNPHALRLCHVGGEYRRMLMVRNFPGVEVYETLDLAKQSFYPSIDQALDSPVSSPPASLL